MGSSKNLSIIMPMYNCCDNVVRTLEKLGHQAIDLNCAEALQVIVIDDGSTDDASLVMETCDLLGFDYVWQENAGGAAACNAGLDRIEGEYFTFIDADDSIMDDYLAIIIDEIKGSYYDFVAHRWQYANGVAGVVQERPLVNWNVWANVYRAELCKHVRFDERLNVAWDKDWLLRAIDTASFKILYSSEVTNIYDTSYPESITNRYNRGELSERKSDNPAES